MGDMVNSRPMQLAGKVIVLVVVALNLYLLVAMAMGL
jgi:manganese transport protein